jgi:hypothetical protein
MKKYLWTFFVLTLFAGHSCQKTLDPKIEEEAIKAVIEEEKDAYLARDANRQSETWIQNENSRKLFCRNDRLDFMNGFNEIDANHKEDTESEMWDQTEDVNAIFSDYSFNFYNHTALVTCTTTWTGKYKGEELEGKQMRILHFVKTDGEWKYDLMAIYNIPEEKDLDEGMEESEAEEVE